MDFKKVFNNVIGKLSNNYTRSTGASFGNDFLRFGNRNRMDADWSQPEMSVHDLYRGYSYAVIQKRGNKVSGLAKTNLRTWAKPEVIDAFQKREEEVYHPYLTLIEDSTKFSEKQFWKNISIYLDLAGRYYLGVVRQPMGNSNKISDVKEFVMLNPYEIRRVVNNQGELAGYIENKSDGRYREWPIDMIIEMRELNPFDPENSQWAMTEAAKDAVFTLQEGGNYTRQSLHGNIDAPGIITTDIILSDEDFANFTERVKAHKKGEPLFGNGAGAIKWESMQVDLDKAALLDISNMNREELFAVSGTSKTALGIEQSGTTRETARVQNENFVADTAQPRLEDIVDFLNLDYKKYYREDYDKTGFYIEVKSATSTDYSIETEATAVRKAQADLALQLIQAKYTPESAYEYATGNIELSDLQLQQGTDLPQTSEEGQDGGDDGNTPNEPNTPTPSNEEQEPEEENKLITNDTPKEQGWVGAKVEKIDILDRLTGGLKSQLYDGDLEEEKTNIPGEENPHFTIIYGLTEEGMDVDFDDLFKQYVPNSVKIENIDTFEKDDYNVIVAKLEKTPELEQMREAYMAQDHYPQEFEDYIPHVTLCYINKNANVEDFYNVFSNLTGKSLKVTGFEVDNPWDSDKDKNDISNSEPVENEIEIEDTCPSCSQKIADFVNELGGADGDALESAYNTLLGEIVGVQHDAIDQAVKGVTINSFTKDDISVSEREGLLERLKKAFKNYWWFIVPMIGERMMSNRNQEFDKDFTFIFNNAVQKKIDDEVTEVAQGHLDTILDDILEASNKAFTKVVEDAAANLIITAYREDANRFSDYFTSEPTKKKVISVIHNTDILEKNRKIYDRAYKLAQDGYNRADIIKGIREEFNFLSTTRANTIAGNETSRAFTQSQYEADYQFLNKVGKLTTAYKQLYSRTGDPCMYCQSLIDKGPIPFTQNFLNKDESITVEENGRTHTFTANYESISAGVVHVNCFHKDTEVYTNKGWRKFSELDHSEKFWSVNPETLKPEWVSAKNYIKAHSDKLIHYYNKNVDMMVTPNHNMFVQFKHKNGDKEYKLVEAQKLPITNAYSFYGGVEWDGEEPNEIRVNGISFTPEQYVKFMGYYLSEGSCGHYKHGSKVSIAQEKSKTRNEMKNTFQNMPFHVVDARRAFEINNKQLVDYCLQFGKCADKYIPQEIKNLSPRLLNMFLDAYIAGDGSTQFCDRTNSTRRSIYTSSIKMRDDLCEVIAKAGYRPTVAKMHEEGKPYEGTDYTTNYDIWRIGVCNRTHSILNCCTVEEVEYSDEVYCVELEKYHTLYTKFNGRCWWSGNCHCGYKLILDYKAENSAEKNGNGGGNPYRDDKGRFATGPSESKKQETSFDVNNTELSYPDNTEVKEEIKTLVNDCITNANTLYGYSPKKITILSMNNGTGKNVEVGRTEVDNDGNPIIYLDERILNNDTDFRKNVARSFESGESTSKDFRGIIDHELVHAVVDNNILKDYNVENVKQVRDAYSRAILAKAYGGPPVKYTDPNNLPTSSNYGKKNAMESVAEIASAQGGIVNKDTQDKLRTVLKQGVTKEDVAAKPLSGKKKVI